MIQDIAPRKLWNHYTEKSPGPGSKIMIFRKGEILLKEMEEAYSLEFPEWREMLPYGEGQEPIFLFAIDETEYFLLEDPKAAPEGCGFRPVREVMQLKPESNEAALAAFTAYHLWEWYSVNRYCGACGSETRRDHIERALVCPSCGNRIYPRINPAVIIGVINGDRILITRYRTGYAHNALVAGFTEIGETLEETVAREVMEEAGVKVKNIRYYKSQPWGIAQDVLMGFYCEVDGDDTIRMDRSEWVDRKDIIL